MRRKGHPSFPSAMTCCFFSSLKTLRMLTEAMGPLARVNVPGSIVGRFWLTAEEDKPSFRLKTTQIWYYARSEAAYEPP